MLLLYRIMIKTKHTIAANAKTVNLPISYNYIGVFLSMRCPNHCPYCINRFGQQKNYTYQELSADDWIRFFSRLNARDIPITLQGGEPGVHRDFLSILKETLKFHPVDILTTLAFDLDSFMREIKPETINRTAPYAPIRVSYHPGQTPQKKILNKVRTLHNKGYRVGLYAVTHPENLTAIEEMKLICKKNGLDFRTKPFLGEYKGRLYGEYAYPDACNSPKTHHCECAPSELLIDPSGNIHACHHHLYNRLTPLANITDSDIQPTNQYLPCDFFGQCNPCDVKVKNNRFQQFGHVSMRIRNIQYKPPSFM